MMRHARAWEEVVQWLPPHIALSEDPAPAPTTMSLSPDQHLVATMVLQRRKSCIVVGPGGTGKTMLIQHLVRQLKKQGLKVCVTSTTGITALPIGGTTLHRFFACPREPCNLFTYLHKLIKSCLARCEQTEVARASLNAWLRRPAADTLMRLSLALKTTVLHNEEECAIHRLQSCQVLVLDEMFMAPPYLLTLAAKSICLLRGGSGMEKPVAWHPSTLQLLFFGDPRQIPCVSGREMPPMLDKSIPQNRWWLQQEEELRDAAAQAWTLQARCMQLPEFQHMVLTTMHRHKSDMELAAMTIRFRTGRPLASDLQRLHRTCHVADVPATTSALTLFSTNARADERNQLAFQSLDERGQVTVVSEGSFAVDPSYPLAVRYMGSVDAAKWASGGKDRPSLPESLFVLCQQRLREMLAAAMRVQTSPPSVGMLSEPFNEERASLTIKCGMRVMITANVNVGMRICNGTLAVVERVGLLDVMNYPPFLAATRMATDLELGQIMQDQGVFADLGLVGLERSGASGAEEGGDAVEEGDAANDEGRSHDEDDSQSHHDSLQDDQDATEGVPTREREVVAAAALSPIQFFSTYGMSLNCHALEEGDAIDCLQPSKPKVQGNRWTALLLRIEGRRVILPIQISSVRGGSYGTLRLCRFPIKLAYASTVDKAQGLTLERACVCVDSMMQRRPGVTYTALSRVPKLSGLQLCGDVLTAQHFASSAFADEYERTKILPVLEEMLRYMYRAAVRNQTRGAASASASASASETTLNITAHEADDNYPSGAVSVGPLCIHANGTIVYTHGATNKPIRMSSTWELWARSTVLSYLAAVSAR